MSDPRPPKKRDWTVTAIKVMIVAVVVAFLWRTIVGAWNDLMAHPRHVDFSWLVAAGAFYLLASLFCGVFWHRILRALGQNVRLTTAIRAFFVGHLGKYVPGKAMVVILRAGMVRGPGVDASLAVVSVFLETLTMMSVGSILAAIVLAVWFRGHNDQSMFFWGSLGMAAVAGLPTLPPIMRWLVRLAGFGKIEPATLEKLRAIGFKIILLGWFLNIFNWIALGLSYWAVLKSIGAEANLAANLHLYIASVAFSTVIGFLSCVPSGAIVREGALVESAKIMLPNLSGTEALLASVLLRLASIAAELFIAGVLTLMRKKEQGK